MANERILIVEDDTAVGDLIARFLHRSGYQVAGVWKSGEEALTAVAQARPDLALMDISLSGELDGVQTAQRFHARHDIPVVFLTGLADDATLRRSHEARAFGYLLKPFRQEDLKTSIELALSKHQFESKLRQIEQRFGAAVQSISDGVITTDPEQRVTFLNPVAEALTGWPQEQALGRPLAEVFRLRSVNDGHGLEGMSGEGNPSALAQPALLPARDGRAIPIECSAAAIRKEDATLGTVLVFRDISERRQAEEELNRSRDQLRSLAAHLESVREEERTRIAREIHDELGQSLTGLKLDTAWLDRRLAAWPDAEARAPLTAKVRGMVELLDSMVQTVRKISADLRPGVLDDLGLEPAMEWQAREWQARTGIECSFTSRLGDLPLPPALGTALFRIFQETLTNVARHAGATRVTAETKTAEGALWLEIHDNGCGIAETDLRRHQSFGVVGMRERTLSLGGEFDIRGEAGRGTSVRVRIPWPAAAGVDK